ncbi:helix-turn-helix domain-containing protein [Lacibacterium aquatile]|uniref:Helix-turn-helix domain-containing protein n=1 Tax=Lacibacterium aquatile TaxID=1168082 RepID=A0ABW5DRL0_9PROT
MEASFNDLLADSLKVLGHRIRSERKRQQLSQEALADGCGLRLGAISDIERGLSVPSFRSLVLIAGALGISLRSLLPEPTELFPDKATDDLSELIAIAKDLPLDRLKMAVALIRVLKNGD